MPFWCETRWRSSACVAWATTGETPNHEPWVLNGMSWTEKAGPDRAAVMRWHSFLVAVVGTAVGTAVVSRGAAGHGVGGGSGAVPGVSP
ncbi:hypothetical protein GCM10027168_58570 [Streptomyces capparidis]